MFFAIRYFFLHKIGHSIETSTIRRVFLIQASSCSFSVPPVLLFLWLLFFWSFKIKNLQNTEKTENVSFVLIAASHTNLCELLVRGWKLKVKSTERLPPLKLTVSTVAVCGLDFDMCITWSHVRTVNQAHTSRSIRRSFRVDYELARRRLRDWGSN